MVSVSVSLCISVLLTLILPLFFVWFDMTLCIHASVYFGVPVFLNSCIILSVWLSDLFMTVGIVRLFLFIYLCKSQILVRRIGLKGQ